MFFVIFTQLNAQTYKNSVYLSTLLYKTATSILASIITKTEILAPEMSAIYPTLKKIMTFNKLVLKAIRDPIVALCSSLNCCCNRLFSNVVEIPYKRVDDAIIKGLNAVLIKAPKNFIKAFIKTDKNNTCLGVFFRINGTSV